MQEPSHPIHGDRLTLGIHRWTVLALTVMVTLGGSAVALGASPAAAQTAGPTVETGNSFMSGLFPLSESAKMLVGTTATMILLAVAELAVIARPSVRWDRVSSFPVILPSLSVPSVGGQSSSGDETATQPESPQSGQQDDFSLTDVDYIGEDRANTFREAGYETVADIAAADRETLGKVDGVGSTRATTIHESATEVMQRTEIDAPPSGMSESGEEMSQETGSGDAASDTNPETDNEAEQNTSPTLTVEFSPENTPNTATVSDSDTAAESRADTDDDTGSEKSRAMTDRDSPPETGNEGARDVLADARASLAEVVRRARGHTRMLFDRRVLDPRAYGATDDWTALAFECSAEGESESVREVLEETVYIGEVPVEITGQTSADRPGRHLSAESSVRVPREGIEQVEEAARAGKPEAKRTVTLLRRALQAEEEQAIRGSNG